MFQKDLFLCSLKYDYETTYYSRLQNFYKPN